MSDKLSGTVKAPATRAVRGVYDSARTLALGLGLLLGGGLLALTGAALPVAAVIGTALLVLGVPVFVVGVYQFADNHDRAARALINGRR